MSAIEYRDKHERPVVIECTYAGQASKHLIPVTGDFFIVEFKTESDNRRIVLNGLPKQPQDVVLAACLQFAKCLVLDQSYLSNWKDGWIELSGNSHNQGTIDFRYEFDGTSVLIRHPLWSRLHIEENRLARRIALDILYNLGPIAEEDIYRESHFPRRPMEREFKGLDSSKYVTSDRDLGPRTLTYEGRQLYESQRLTEDNTVFIIAACHANCAEKNPEEEDAHRCILKAYSDILKEHGYKAIFQEEEEHRKSIHIDIQEYIDNCAFVVADITYDRPNCYVEIGYALARGKHVIGFYQKEYVDEQMANKKRESRIPFDLNTYKFQEYPRGNVKILRERIEARIGAVRTMKSSHIS